MKIKKNLHIFISAGIGFLLLYGLLASRPLNDELQLIPKWTSSVLNLAEGEVGGDGSYFPFRLGQSMGYFSSDGEIVLLESFPFQATISSHYRAAYAPNSTKIGVHVFDPAQGRYGVGSPDFFVPGAGFPFFSDDRIYLLSPGGYGLSQYTPEGIPLWQFEHSSPIVALSSSAAGTAVGYADGQICIFSPEGKMVQEFEPGGSAFPVVLGVALSGQGNYMACVSGIDQQRFVLTQYRNGINKVVYHDYLEGNLREPALVHFSRDGGRVFFDCFEGLGMVDCKTYSNAMIPIKGRVVSIQECVGVDLICVLTKGEGGYHVYFIEDGENLVGSFDFEAASAFITIDSTDLYIGRNDTISKIELAYE